MPENNSPQKLSLFVLCLDQKQNLDNLTEHFSYADDIILIGFDFKENFISNVLKSNIRLLDLSLNDQPILDFAKNDIILLLNLDENINESLKDEIIEVIENGFENKGYFIKRDFFFINKKIKYGAVENTTEIRLFNRKFCSLKDNLPLIGNVVCNQKTGILTHKIQNLSYNDFDSYNFKQAVYNDIIAKMLFKKGIKLYIIQLLSVPLFFFIKQYFIKLGFLDKKEGYILAYIHSFGKLKSQIKVWLLKNNIN